MVVNSNDDTVYSNYCTTLITMLQNLIEMKIVQIG